MSPFKLSSCISNSSAPRSLSICLQGIFLNRPFLLWGTSKKWVVVVPTQPCILAPCQHRADAYKYWNEVSNSPTMSLPYPTKYWLPGHTHRALSDLAAGVTILSTAFVSHRRATIGCQLSQSYFRCLIWSFAAVSPSPSSPVSHFFSSSRCSFQNPLPTPDDHSTLPFHSPLSLILVL